MHVVCVCVCVYYVEWALVLDTFTAKEKFCNIELPELVILIWEDGKVWNELAKATLLWWARSRENPFFILPSPMWAHAHMHTDIHTYMRTQSRRGFSSHGLPTGVICPRLQQPYLFVP